MFLNGHSDIGGNSEISLFRLEKSRVLPFPLSLRIVLLIVQGDLRVRVFVDESAQEVRVIQKGAEVRSGLRDEHVVVFIVQVQVKVREKVLFIVVSNIQHKITFIICTRSLVTFYFLLHILGLFKVFHFLYWSIVENSPKISCFQHVAPCFNNLRSTK